MWIISNPTDNQTHVVRNRRTDMILGLECGKPAGIARATPLPDADLFDVTCTKCRERAALVAA